MSIDNLSLVNAEDLPVHAPGGDTKGLVVGVEGDALKLIQDRFGLVQRQSVAERLSCL
jgi:hypothetical protein